MNLLQKIKNNGISNIYVSGFIEIGNKLFSFHPMYQVLYIESNSLLFSISIKDDLSLLIKDINEITCWFDLDEDDKFGYASIYNQIFKTEFDTRIKDIFFAGKDKNILCIEYFYNETETRLVKLDPVNFFGFCIYNETKNE